MKASIWDVMPRSRGTQCTYWSAVHYVKTTVLACKCVLFLVLCACASRMPVQVNRVLSCRSNRLAVLPLDITTHSSLVRKQVFAISMCCYLSSVLSNGVICSHALVILRSISVRLCVVNRTVLSYRSAYVVTIHTMNRGWTPNPTAHHR